MYPFNTEEKNCNKYSDELYYGKKLEDIFTSSLLQKLKISENPILKQKDPI